MYPPSLELTLLVIALEPRFNVGPSRRSLAINKLWPQPQVVETVES